MANLLPPKSKKGFDAKLVQKGGKKFEVKSAEEAQAVEEGLRGASYVAREVKRGEKTRHAAPPFTTSNLQQEAARQAGLYHQAHHAHCPAAL